VDAITCHRLDLLGLDARALAALSLPERLDRAYEVFLQRVPFENLSNAQACAAAPEEPESWPRTTDRFLREHRACGLGGTSFTLAYALRDLFLGLGANAHCTLGHNLVVEEAHAAVLVYLDGEEPRLYDPALLLSGSVPVRPGGRLEDPLGALTLRPRHGATLTLCLQVGSGPERCVYSLVPAPTPPQSFRQAWVASFLRGRRQPLRLARRVGDEIRRYAQRPGLLVILRAGGTERRKLPAQPVDTLQELFGIREHCLRGFFGDA
jgi:hypothetical protein